MSQPEGAGAAVRGWRAIEGVGVVVILVVAALARFMDLPTRGMWDSDQGHDMLVLLALVRDGSVPLVGPPTSIGDFHHGAIYYYLLAPAALVSGADPIAVVALIAAAGVVAVGVVWWLARSIGGPIAGLVAALLMAVSATAIEESTFIWNPNLIALSSSIAFAAAWRAWKSWRTRWWLVAAAALAVTMQLHVLGWVLIVPFAALLIADARRTSSVDRAGVWRTALGSILVIAMTYLPLLVHELASGFRETRAVAAFLTGGGSETATLNPAARIVIVGLRTLSWPLAGLITAAPIAAFIAALAMLGVCVWRLRAGSGRERQAAAWFGATLAWSIVVLAIAAPSLATVVEGLPNDHYHAFLDSIVFVLAGLGVAALWRWRVVGRFVAAAVVVAVGAFNVATWPPAVAPDGGWPAAEAAAQRVVSDVGANEILLVGIPEFKPTDALAFPLTRIGRAPEDRTEPQAASESTSLVIVCDRLFESVTLEACGGFAEDATVERLGGGWQVVERFEVWPPAGLPGRTSISIYRKGDTARRDMPTQDRGAARPAAMTVRSSVRSTN